MTAVSLRERVLFLQLEMVALPCQSRRSEQQVLNTMCLEEVGWMVMPSCPVCARIAALPETGRPIERTVQIAVSNGREKLSSGRHDRSFRSNERETPEKTMLYVKLQPWNNAAVRSCAAWFAMCRFREAAESFFA